MPQCAVSGRRDILPMALLSLSQTQWTGHWASSVIIYNVCYCLLSRCYLVSQANDCFLGSAPRYPPHLHLYAPSASGGASLAQVVGQALQ